MHGLIGKITATPGHRDELIEILIGSTVRIPGVPQLRGCARQRGRPGLTPGSDPLAVFTTPAARGLFFQNTHNWCRHGYRRHEVRLQTRQLRIRSRPLAGGNRGPRQLHRVVEG